MNTTKMVSGRQARICFLTTSHKATDTRLFGRQALSLSKGGYQLSVIGLHDKAEEIGGIRVIPISHSGRKLQRFIRSVYRVFFLALEQNAKVYHFHDPELIPVGLLLKLLRKKVIYDVHEDYEKVLLSRRWVNPTIRKPLSNLFFLLEHTASKSFDYIITADSNIQRKFPPEKTQMISNAPPLRFLATSSKRELHANTPSFRLAFIGSISDDCGVDKVLDSLPHLNNKKGVELHLVGSISSTVIGERVKKLPEVFCHGRLPWEEAQRVLANSDLGLFLYPPSPQYLGITGEGVTKLFEYISAGIPVLYSNFPNLKKLIDKIGCGYPVDPTYPRQIAEAIEYLMENDQIRKSMVEKGRLAMHDRYNWEFEEQKLLGIYKRLLGCG